MKAMILAAGLGTRLKPLTDRMPKALVEVEGIPMLERVILALKKQGFNYIVVNVHHFPDQIIDFIRGKDFGIEISISDERDELLDTGGGIVKASSLLFKKDETPLLVHNVDILSNADLQSLINATSISSTLLVNERDTTRKLLFDDSLNLKGWHDLKNNVYRPEGFKNDERYQELAFSGIYTMTKSSVDEMKEICGEGKYSVIEYFLHPKRKEEIKGFKVSDLKLLDIGKPTTLSQASKYIS